jgi:hypothetical protein
MSKKLVIFLVGVILAGVIAVVVMVRLYGWGKSYPIFNELSNVQNAPEIQWGDVTSGSLARFLHKSRKEGQLQPLTGEMIPVESIQTTGEGLYKQLGIRYIELSNADVRSLKYSEIAKRPYHFVAIYRTKIVDEAYLVLVQEWSNIDGSVEYVPLLLLMQKVIEGDGTTEYFEQTVIHNEQYFFSPIMQYQSEEVCKVALGKADRYCEWYFGSARRSAKYITMMETWTSSGIVPNDIGAYPAMYTRSPVEHATK